MPSGSLSRRPREPPSTPRSWRLPGPREVMPAQRPHTQPSPQAPSHPYPALLSSTGETCSWFWGTDWPSKPQRDPMPRTRQDRLQSWAGSLGGSCGEDPKGAEATPPLWGPSRDSAPSLLTQHCRGHVRGSLPFTGYR